MILLQHRIINGINNEHIFTKGPFFDIESTMEEMKEISNENQKTKFYNNTIRFHSNENIFKETIIENAKYSYFTDIIDNNKTLKFLVIEIQEISPSIQLSQNPVDK